MKRLMLLMGVGIITFGLVGCGQVPKLKNGKEVVASLEGKKFTAEDLYASLKQQGGQVTLVQMVDEFILNKEIETDEDAKTYADSQLESYKSSYESYGKDLEKTLVQSGFESIDDFRDYLIIEYKKQEATENFVKGKITDAEIEDYYENKVFGDIEARHILISPDVDENATDEEKEAAEKKAKEKAEKLIKELDDGADFEKLAKENSDDSGTAKNGGKLTISYGDVVDEVWDAASKLKNKKYTKSPVKSEYGYHIIYRINQKDKPKLNSVRDSIIDDLTEEKISNDTTLQTQALVDLRKKYGFKINDDEVNKAYNTAVKEALSANTENSSN